MQGFLALQFVVAHFSELAKYLLVVGLDGLVVFFFGIDGKADDHFADDLLVHFHEGNVG